jgi:uncharacterized protein involved in exopolysaccharide biosynthesis
MDLLTALKILLRQWPIVLAGLLLTFFGVKQVGEMVTPTYEAKSTVLLLSPGAGNQYLEFPAGLEVTADALVVVLQNPVAGKQVEAAGATGAYSLERTTGPLVDITANASTASEAKETIDVVIQGLRAELARYQVDTAADQLITLEVLTEPTAKAKLGSRIRAQAAVGAIGVAATVAAGLATDAIRRQRREAKARREEARRGEARRDDESRLDSDGDAASDAYEWELTRVGPLPTGSRRTADEQQPVRATNGAHSGGPPMTNGSSGGRNARPSTYPGRPTPVRPPLARRPTADGSARDGARSPWQ